MRWEKKSSRRQNGRRRVKKDEVLFDQDATPNAIFGDGNTNGFYTCTREDGIELCLRAKIRYPVALNPTAAESNGDGTYNMNTGTPAPVSLPIETLTEVLNLKTFKWNFEWSINTNFDGSTEFKLLDVTHFEIGMDCDPSCDATFTVVNPFDVPKYIADLPENTKQQDPPIFPDHSFGDNGTQEGDGLEPEDLDELWEFLETKNVAQNSWNFGFFNNPGSCLVYADPSAQGTYTIYMKAVVDDEEYTVSINVEARNPVVIP